MATGTGRTVRFVEGASFQGTSFTASSANGAQFVDITILKNLVSPTIDGYSLGTMTISPGTRMRVASGATISSGTSFNLIWVSFKNSDASSL